jgi:GT2 family glycosyltransferase
VAVFDADFHPESDFLLRTIPYLRDNPAVGFVQARWTFANASESLLTRVQEISLNYHTKCEQYARSASGAFLNFNGTAGVWRRECIEKAGGWNARTTVEDMDLSLRAYLQGWQFVFLHDVECVNELPSSYDAYRKQQHRWSCGPMQLWKKATAAVWASNISWAQKLYLNVFFFGTRLFATRALMPSRRRRRRRRHRLSPFPLRRHRFLLLLLHHRAYCGHCSRNQDPLLGAHLCADCGDGEHRVLHARRLEVHGGLHPVRERDVRRQDERCVPSSLAWKCVLLL